MAPLRPVKYYCAHCNGTFSCQYDITCHYNEEPPCKRAYDIYRLNTALASHHPSNREVLAMERLRDSIPNSAGAIVDRGVANEEIERVYQGKY